MSRPLRLPRRSAAVASSAALLLALSVPTATPASAAPTDPGTVPISDVRPGQWWLDSLGIKQAWPASKQGQGVKVGVLDSGVVGSVPDLRGAVVGGKDFSGKGSADGQTPIKDGDKEVGDPHGTSMAGFIAGRGYGGKGMLGVAPKASIVTASVAVEAGGFEKRTEEASEPALRWLADQGVKVINVSLNDPDISAADIAYVQRKDVVVVAPVGNDGAAETGIPAKYPGVVAVGGIDRDLGSDFNSNRASPHFAGGDTSTSPEEAAAGTAIAAPFSDRAVDTTAPGAEASGMVTLTTGGTYYKRTFGTSNSSAIVSGVAALIRAAHPEMNAANVISRLVQTARHLNPKSSGWSPAQGFGVPNAYRAITTDVPEVCENPLGSQTPPLSNGIWVSIYTKKPYQPACEKAASSSSSAAPSTSGSSSADAIGPSSDSSSGVPVWVWPVVAVVVIAVIGGAVLSRRSRRTTH